MKCKSCGRDVPMEYIDGNHCYLCIPMSADDWQILDDVEMLENDMQRQYYEALHYRLGNEVIYE